VKNKEPLAPKKFGRPKTYLEEANRLLILKIHKEQNCGARRLECIIDHRFGRRISHNAIHQVLLENDLANENKKKKKRRKPWIRYERKHSLTAVHLDWHTSRFNGIEVCVVLDYCSRFVLAGGERSAATVETSINLVKRVLDEYGEIRRIKEVITDHGTQFFANKKDKKKKMNLRVNFRHSWQRMKSSISWPESSILRPMEKSKNGIIPTRKK